MKAPDLDRIRSEKRIPLASFLESYNEGLPSAFPHASLSLLSEYRKAYPGQFKEDGLWSLDEHRKKIMDWLPGRLKAAGA